VDLLKISKYERVELVSRLKKALYLQLILHQNRLEYFKAFLIFDSMTGAYKSGVPYNMKELITCQD
jgi:hypothetical protein